MLSRECSKHWRKPIAYSPRGVWAYEECPHCNNRSENRLRKDVFDPLDHAWLTSGVFSLPTVASLKDAEGYVAPKKSRKKEV